MSFSMNSPAAVDRPSVAIVLGESLNTQQLEHYAIHGMVEFWRRQGIAVEYFTDCCVRARQADVLFMHVDRSKVPVRLLRSAQGHPCVLNGHIGDIRKSVVCGDMLHRHSDYTGPVIVKTNLNSAGLPEARDRNRWQRLVYRLRKKYQPPALHIRQQVHYRVYPTLAEVPPACFTDHRLVIQKFLPERDEGLYQVRSYSFLGDRSSCMRLSSEQPIVSLGNACRVEAVEPHPDIVALRHTLRMDYGKLDYVQHHGGIVLLDVNKTLGARRNESHPLVLAMREERAQGIFSYFNTRTSC